MLLLEGTRKKILANDLPSYRNNPIPIVLVAMLLTKEASKVGHVSNDSK